MVTKAPEPVDVPRMADDLSEADTSKYENLLAAVDPLNEVVVVDEEKEEERPAEEESDEKPDESESEEDEDESAESDESSDDEEATEKPEADASGDTFTLPAAHVRSLKAYGWDDDEIKQAVEKLGAEFLPTAAKIHANRVAETQQYAAIGRAHRDQQASQSDIVPPASQTASDTTSKNLARVDIDALKKEHGDDEVINSLIDRMAGPMNSAIEALNLILPQVSESAARTQRTEEAGLARQVEQFFGRGDMKAFELLYGGVDTNLVTDPQWQARASVLQQADALQVGAGYQGRQMELTEALELAHDSVSSEFKTDAIRKEIKGKVKKRTKAITLKPTKKAALSPTGKPGDRTELLSRARQNLAKAFGG